MGRCGKDSPVTAVSRPFRPLGHGAALAHDTPLIHSAETLAAGVVAVFLPTSPPAAQVAEPPSQGRPRFEWEAKLAGSVIRAGRLALDTGRMEANAGQGSVRLTRQEFLLLKEFVSHPGRTVPRPALLAAVWGLNFDPGSNVVDVCVRRLRSKLGFDLIRTVRGEGYQLLADLPQASSAAL